MSEARVADELPRRPKVLASTVGMSRAEWLAARRKGIGSSDVAAIAGLNPWRSALAVYMDKTSQLPEEPENDAMHFGTVLEPVVAEEFACRTGFLVRRVDAILQHPDHPWALCNLDREVEDGEPGLTLVECKTASQYNADQWADGKIPDYYMLQVQHQLWVCGYNHGYIAVLIGGNRFEFQRIEADPEIAAYLEQIEAAFWQRVEQRNPPPADGSESSAAALSLLYPQAEVEETLLPVDAEGLLQQYDRAAADEKEAKARKEEAQQKLCALLGAAEVGVIAGERVCSWRTQHRDAHMTKAADFRKFARIKPRGVK